MDSKLILGCKRCQDKLKETEGLSMSLNGEFKLLFPINTEFKQYHLTELYSNPYICPFCNKELELTPKMLKFINSFFDKIFHVEIVNGYIEISNGELSFSVPLDKEINSVKEFLSDYGLIIENADNYLPTADDIRLIQTAANEYDHKEWILRIESGNALEPYFSAHGLWFNDLNDN